MRGYRYSYLGLCSAVYSGGEGVVNIIMAVFWGYLIIIIP